MSIFKNSSELVKHKYRILSALGILFSFIFFQNCQPFELKDLVVVENQSLNPPIEVIYGDHGKFKLWTAPSTTKVGEDQILNQVDVSVKLSAARNEYESAQILIYGLENTSNIDIRSSDLQGSDGYIIPSSSVKLYRVHYVNCEKDGAFFDGCIAEGAKPDSMVPFIDPVSGEKIGGLYGAPFSLQNKKNSIVWVEIHVPAQAAPGLYKAFLTISSNGKDIDAVPIELTVWPVTLAKTTELKTYFNLEWNKHPKRAYLHSLHEHRIDVWSIKNIETNYAYKLTKDNQGKTIVEFLPETEQLMQGYFDGSLFKDGVPGKNYLFGYNGYPGRGFDNSFNETLKADSSARVDVFKQFEAKYAHKPWVDKVAWFVVDEPQNASQMENVRDIGLQIKEHSPSIGYLLTSSYHKELEDLVTIWDPIIDYQVLRNSSPGPEPYRSEMSKGRSVINNITMMSNNSTTPNIFLKYSGMNTRIWTWATWMLGHDGIEFWETQPSPSVKTMHVYSSKVPGDGTLFYRGLPSELGIAEEIALPSLRLKILRDGIEDYELLAMLHKKNPTEARRIGRMMAQETNSYDSSFEEPIQHMGRDSKKGHLIWEKSHSRLLRARAALAKALSN